MLRKFHRAQLQECYEHDANFRRRVDRSEQVYAQLLKREQALEVHESLMERFLGEERECTYFFYGCLQPAPAREKELLLYLVRNLQPAPGEPFTFVYFNQHTPSSDYYFRFKNVFDLLPLRLIEMMRVFYLVKPYFYIKAFDMLGQSNRVFAAAYRPLDSAQELLRREGYRVHDFVTFVPEEISEEFPSHLKRRPSLLTYRINLEGQNLSEEQLREKRDFENSVRALITKEVYKLENYEVGAQGVPVVLQQLVGYFKEKPGALLQEGIFRKSVSVDEENDTLAELATRNFAYLHQITNPHLIASLIKKFFSNLKEPVIPYPLFERLLRDPAAARPNNLHALLATLPQLNFLSLMFVVDFLRRDVVPVERETKMGAHNLAICFSPAFMRSEKPSFADIANAGKAVVITEAMINEFEAVFGQEQQRNKLFEKSMMERRVDLKKNLNEELNIRFDDRNSEESSLEHHTHHEQQHEQHEQHEQLEQHEQHEQHEQPVWGTLVTKEHATLSKEVYKSEIRQQPPKSEEINLSEAPTALHQAKSEIIAVEGEGEYDLPKSKKTKFELVQLILKNKQEDPSAPPPPPPPQLPSVMRSTLGLDVKEADS